jgi:hypothetical protein
MTIPQSIPVDLPAESLLFKDASRTAVSGPS